MTVRLRLAGEPAAARVPVRDDPPALPKTIAVVAAGDAGDAEGMAALLAPALGGAVRWRVQPWSRDGAELVEQDGVGWLRAAPDALDAAIDGLRAAGWSVGVGAALVALRRPVLAILVTGGAPAVHWDPEVRAIRDRFDLVIEEPRPALARELAARLTRVAAAAT